MRVPDSQAPAASKRGSRARWGRIALIGVVFVSLYVVGQAVADMAVRQFDLVMHVRSEPIFHRMIMTAGAIYFALLTVPFMPGAEVGLSMIVFFGPRICFLVYVVTVLALIPPYLVGRLIPARYCSRAFEFLGFTRLRRLVDEMAPLSADARLDLLLDRSRTRIAPFLLRHRFIALAVLLNVPGNVLIGGGGGIAMMAGITGLYPLPAYVLTVALAVAPVPLLIRLTELGL